MNVEWIDIETDLEGRYRIAALWRKYPNAKEYSRPIDIPAWKGAFQEHAIPFLESLARECESLKRKWKPFIDFWLDQYPGRFPPETATPQEQRAFFEAKESWKREAKSLAGEVARDFIDLISRAGDARKAVAKRIIATQPGGWIPYNLEQDSRIPRWAGSAPDLRIDPIGVFHELFSAYPIEIYFGDYSGISLSPSGFEIALCRGFVDFSSRDFHPRMAYFFAWIPDRKLEA